MTREPMRILHLITNLRPDGAQNVLLDTLRHWPTTTDEHTIGFLFGSPIDLAAAQLDSCRLLDLSWRGRPNPGLIWRLPRLLRRERFDILHTHLVHAGVAGKLAATFAGYSAVITTRHYAWDQKESTALYRLENRFTGRCAAVIAVSNAVRDYLIEKRIAPARRVVTIPNGVDLRRFDPRRYPTRVATSQDGPRIGIVGRLHAQKGHAIGLRAFGRVLRTFPRATLEIVGDGVLRDRLEGEARSLRIMEQVRFVGGLPHAEIPSRMAGWDLAMFPSVWEGFCIAAAEAMAMELPVVASHIEGLAEVVEDGKTGVLVSPGDPEALAEAILRLLSAPGMAKDMGWNGRIRTMESFNISRSAARVRQLYATVLDGLPL